MKRVKPEELYRIEDPAGSALLFVWGRALPWRAYLSRYGRRVPLVVIIGATEPDGCTEPSAVALDGLDGWRCVQRLPMHGLHEGATLAAYERRAAADAPGEALLPATAPLRMAPSFRVNQKAVEKYGLPLY